MSWVLKCVRYSGVIWIPLLFILGVVLGYRWRYEAFYFPGLIAVGFLFYCGYKVARHSEVKKVALALVFLLGGIGAGSMAVNAYAMNSVGMFYLSLFLGLDLLILVRINYTLGGAAKIGVHSAVLAIVLLPLADLATRPNRRVDQMSLAKRPYSYETARRDPVTFKRWWERYIQAWQDTASDTQMPDPKRQLPFRLKPNSRGKLFESEVRINNLGFRGADFAREKQGEFRIVALGESTTMGCTLAAADSPWPEVLEKMIAQRLKPTLPVRVINAGVQAYSLENNLSRMADDILPLHPDVIISYHGYNGFGLINNNLPPVAMEQTPRFIDRPIYILARCEYHLRWLVYLKRYRPQTVVSPRRENGRDTVLESTLAHRYEELIAIAKTNGIRLVLANFNLAVNAQSDPDLIEFYRPVFPEIDEIIPLNDANTWMLEQLARRHPEVLYLNTQSNLHGLHDKFIDLVHFTQEGREQLAENIFTGIRSLIPQAIDGDKMRHAEVTERP